MTDLAELIRRIPLFAELEARGRQDPVADLVMGARFEQAPKGGIVVNQGDMEETARILLHGRWSVFRTDQGMRRLWGTYGPRQGGWLSITTWLYHLPQVATIRTEEDCLFLSVEAPLMRRVFKDPAGLLDHYRARELPLHLRVVERLKAVSPRVLKRLAKAAKIETFKGGSRLGEGAADAFFLVLSGHVEEWRGGAVAAYHPVNSSFFVDPGGDGAFIASSDEVLAVVVEDVSEVAEIPVEGEDVAEGVDVPAEAFQRRVVEAGGEALVINTHRCTRCNACVESCVAVHADRIPRLSKDGIHLDTADHVLASACYNCTTPLCMMECNFGAIRRDVAGAIHIIDANCTGCGACSGPKGCPFGVIRMAPLVEDGGAEREARSFLQRMLGFLARRGPLADPEGPSRAVKCDLCAGLPFEACVYNCPYDAIRRERPADLLARPRGVPGA